MAKRQDKVKAIVEYAQLLKLDAMVQGDMPGFVVSISNVSGRYIFTGNMANATAFLDGYGNGLRCTDTTNPHYDKSAIPNWYGNR